MISPKKAVMEQLYAVNITIGNYIFSAVDAVNDQRDGTIACHIAGGTKAIHRDI